MLKDRVDKRDIIVCVTGGVAIYKACEVVRRLRADGTRPVQVLMSASAREFIQPLLFQNLSGNPVAAELFGPAPIWDPCHIAYADRAALVVVVPATAHTIAKVALGLCDDVISCVISATTAPVLFCPAMNDTMWAHPAVQENVRRLRAFGYALVGPTVGGLVCGREGEGHLAAVEDILAAIRQQLP